VRTPDEVLHALFSSSELKTASRASVAIFDAPWQDDAIPQYCSLLAAWNSEAEVPLLVGQPFTLEGYGFVPPYARDKPIVIEDVRSAGGLSESVRRRFEMLKTRSLIIFPLIAGDEWYGALSLQFRLRRAIALEDLRHLRGLVDQAAIAINNFRSLDAEATARREAEEANALAVLAMIHTNARPTSIKGFATTLLADDVQCRPTASAIFADDCEKPIAERTNQLLLDLSPGGGCCASRRSRKIERILNTAMAHAITAGIT
jgi:GAF domain-containing protein